MPARSAPITGNTSRQRAAETELEQGAGLDVSPAVRAFLGMEDTDVTDWKFVEFSEVPHGPWSKHGDNNTFVINARKIATELVANPTPGGVTIRP